jgi:hypothetical protein
VKQLHNGQGRPLGVNNMAIIPNKWKVVITTTSDKNLDKVREYLETLMVESDIEYFDGNRKYVITTGDIYSAKYAHKVEDRIFDILDGEK